jgi:putative FmdB family regulatory protein
MPLFEYACKSCDRHFEWLTRGAAAPECPSCHGTNLEKRQSVFAARSTGAPAGAQQVSPGACGTCGDPRGPGSWSIN